MPNAHELIDQLTRALGDREVSRSADHGGPIAVEFALRRAEQQWSRLAIAEMAASVAAGIAAHHGLTAGEARQLADTISDGLRAVGDDQVSGREWLRALGAYAVASAREAGR